MKGPLLHLQIAADHPAYAGHFPGRPILPGVLLLDEAVHALAIEEGLLPAVGRIRSAKFPSPVWPGEDLRLRYAATAGGDFRIEVLAGERVAASAVVAFAESVAWDGAS
jgi:3-hydroxyacyl-[acyl-carrier-protein] dehydratase